MVLTTCYLDLCANCTESISHNAVFFSFVLFNRKKRKTKSEIDKRGKMCKWKLKSLFSLVSFFLCSLVFYFECWLQLLVCRIKILRDLFIFTVSSRIIFFFQSLSYFFAFFFFVCFGFMFIFCVIHSSIVEHSIRIFIAMQWMRMRPNSLPG